MLARAAVTLLAFTLVAARPATAKPLITFTGKSVSLSGTMDEEMLSAVKGLDLSGIRTIRFSSDGGMPLPALTIARLLASSGAQIEIHNVCASACLDVLVIRSRVTVEPGTLVLLHNTAAGQSLTVATNYPHVSEYLKAIGAADVEWLRQNRIDARLELLAEAAIQPICVRAASDSIVAVPRMLTATRYAVWAPRDDTLRYLGLRTKGNWHQDSNSVVEIMQKRFPHADLKKLRAADEPHPPYPSDAVLAASLKRTPLCPPALLARVK